MSNYKLELKNLSLVRGGSPVLNNINLKFKEGTKSLITGKSGSGKTSLLRLLNRLNDPSEGKIYYNGLDIKDMNVIDLRRQITLVPQIPIIFDKTVKDNITIQSKFGISPCPSLDQITKTLELCGLSQQFLDKDANQLSVGEKQRVCIARSIINKPDVLLLDEPTSSLDYDNSVSIYKLINNLNTELGITIIMVTHKIEESAVLNAEYYTLLEGKIKKEANS